MALPLLFMLAGTLVRAATPAIARAIAQRGAKKVAESGIKNALKKYGKPKNITSLSKVKSMKGSGASDAAKEVMKKFPVPKNKSLTIPKSKSKVGAKIVAGGSTVITGAAALSTDKKKSDAKAATTNKKKGKVDVGLQEALKKKKKKKVETPQGVSQGSTAGTATTMTFGKAFRAAKDAGKKEFTYRGKRYHTRTKDEEKKSEATKKFGMGKVDSLSKSKVEKKKVRKTDNMEGGTAPIKTKKVETKKKSKSFLDRVKEDFNKAVKETKRNFGPGRYTSATDKKKKMMGGGYSMKRKK